MGFFQKLFGPGKPSPAERAQLDLEQRAREASGKADAVGIFEPLSVARRFAARVPGAVAEDYAGGARARVSFTHQGSPLRLAFFSSGDRFVAYLEARAVGKLGSFQLTRRDPGMVFGAPTDDEPEQALFLSKTCFVISENPRIDAARVLSLPEPARATAFELCVENEALLLRDEVLSVLLCDVFQFVVRSERDLSGPPYGLAVATRLLEIAAALPAQSREHTELAEARTCRYCSTDYVFAPRTPECARCGAPPEVDPPLEHRA